MQTKKSEESRRLLRSVKEFFNGSKELNLRRDELRRVYQMIPVFPVRLKAGRNLRPFLLDNLR